jgi:hypothetical protein
MEVWIYFLSLEFWPGAEIGTLPSLLPVPRDPQYVVVPYDPEPEKGYYREAQNPA